MTTECVSIPGFFREKITLMAQIAQMVEYERISSLSKYSVSWIY